MRCRMEGANASAASSPTPAGLGAPMRHFTRQGPCVGLQHVDQGLAQEGLNRGELASAHTLDLLGAIRPIQFDVIDQLTGGAATQQVALLLGPLQDVLVVKIVHNPPG